MADQGLISQHLSSITAMALQRGQEFRCVAHPFQTAENDFKVYFTILKGIAESEH